MEEINTSTNFELNDYESAYDDAYLCEEEREDIPRQALQAKIEGLSFREQITTIIGNDEVCSSLEKKIEELHIKDIEGFLGCGNNGGVYLVDGGSILPREKLALKVNRFATAKTVKESGEALALTMPHHNSLNRIYGILTFDGNSVRYIDRLEDADQDDRVVGLFAEYIQGKNLTDLLENASQEASENKKILYDFTIVEWEEFCLGLSHAIHTLHKNNIVYDRESFKGRNIIAEINSENKIQRLVLGDFGRSFVPKDHRTKNALFYEDNAALGKLNQDTLEGVFVIKSTPLEGWDLRFM